MSAPKKARKPSQAMLFAQIKQGSTVTMACRAGKITGKAAQRISPEAWLLTTEDAPGVCRERNVLAVAEPVYPLV